MEVIAAIISNLWKNAASAALGHERGKVHAVGRAPCAAHLREVKFAVAGAKRVARFHQRRAIDGREEYATRFVWGRVVDLWRDSPIPLTGDQMASEMRDAFSMYERAVKSRLVDPGVPNHVLLEREGRGISMFKHKWDHAISQWDGKVSEHGQKEPPRKHEAQTRAPLSQPVEGNIKFNPETGEIFRELPPDGVYEVLNVNEIKT